MLKNPLVLVLGNRYLLENKELYTEVKKRFPDGHIVFGSTSGEISGGTVNDDSLTITAVEFEKSTFAIKTSNILNSGQDSFKTGSQLVQKFSKEGLKYVFVLSEGSFINGSELTKRYEFSNCQRHFNYRRALRR